MEIVYVTVRYSCFKTNLTKTVKFAHVKYLTWTPKKKEQKTKIITKDGSPDLVNPSSIAAILKRRDVPNKEGKDKTSLIVAYIMSNEFLIIDNAQQQTVVNPKNLALIYSGNLL